MHKKWRTNGDHASAALEDACIDNNELVDYISEMQPWELKDFLCDVVGVNHHTSKEDILKLLGEKF